MIHFTCDACRRTIDQDEETRYVVRVEVYAALGDEAEDPADEEDHLQDIDELLEKLDEIDDVEPDEGVYKQVRYDLCEQCRKQFLRDPLGRNQSVRLGFSQN